MNARSSTNMKKTVTDAQLQALVAVAEQGSFTRAGRALGMSQSAVSHAMTALEEALQVCLLERNSRGVRLTELGEGIVHHAREALRHKALIRQQAETARGLRQGVVRIGSFGPTSSRHLLPPILEQLDRHYPKLEIRVSEGSDLEVEQWLHDNQIDAGFVTLPNENLDCIHLARDELMVLLPADSTLARYASIRTEWLAGQPFIMSTGGCEPAIETLLQQGSLDVQYRIREVQTIVEIVAGGAGLSLPAPLPAGVVTRSLDPPSWREVGLAFAGSGRSSPAVGALFRLATAVARTRKRSWSTPG